MSKTNRNFKISIESRNPKGRLPTPSDFKMGTQAHSVKRREDYQSELVECDKCALCQQTDVIDSGEYLDSETWVCYRCIENEAESLDDDEE